MNSTKACEKKRVLIYAHYYYPDMASTGRVLTELAEGMIGEFDITVICVVPSSSGVIEQKYKKQRLYFEEINSVKVIRVHVSEFDKRNKLSRIKNILGYFINGIIATFKAGKQDYIFTITQPPIIGGFIGVLGKWIKHAKLIYNIQDFNPEQIMAVSYVKKKSILKFAMMIDKFSCRHSDLIITLGNDMVETLRNRFNNKRVPKSIIINNWIDEKVVYPLESDNSKVIAFKKEHGLLGKFVICNSGNLGLYYGFADIMEVIKRFKDDDNVIFTFIGEGAYKQTMIDFAEKNHLTNVRFIPFLSKEEMNYSLNSADAHWVTNGKGIKGVSVPGKVYTVIAAGKPVLAVMEPGAEARLLVEKLGCGLTADPGDVDGIQGIVRHMILNKEEFAKKGLEARSYLEKNLTKERSIQNTINAIKTL